MSLVILIYPKEDTPKVCEEGGFLHVDTWTLRVGDQRLGGRVHPDVMDDPILPQGRNPDSFVLISLLEVYQEKGPLLGYFEDIEGSCLETWRIGSPKISQRGHQNTPVSSNKYLRFMP